MAIIFKCDVCDVVEDDEIKVYEVGKQVKEECFDGVNHICKQCLADANEDKTLTTKDGKVVYKNSKYTNKDKK